MEAAVEAAVEAAIRGRELHERAGAPAAAEWEGRGEHDVTDDSCSSTPAPFGASYLEAHAGAERGVA